MPRTAYSNRARAGFTLMEMLIVIAVIAVLIAIAIPVFSAQLEKSREATDAANERTALGVATADYLSGIVSTGTYYFDASSGQLSSGFPANTYGKGTAAGDVAEDHTDMVVACTIASDGTVTTSWARNGLNGNVTGSSIMNMALNDILKKLGLTGKRYDSTSGSNDIAKIEAALKEAGVDLDTQGINSWAILTEGSGSSSTKTFWWTDVDISQASNGDMVRVVRYNPNKGTYTAAYAKVETSSSGNYLAFNGTVSKDTSTWQEAAGQNDTTKKSYSDTVAVFNKMSKTKQ